ncbi:MAG: efflux RND transporter permease subunit, partial [Oscillospiraceae bacterium]
MKLPKYAIENHQFTIIFTVLLILTGIVSFITMPRSEDPEVSPAGSSVLVILPGANPQDVEELIIDPVEEVLNELEDIKHIRSRATDGFANIEIEFLAGSDPDDKYSDVVQKVNSIRSSLPDQIFSIDIMKWSVSDVNILQFALVTDSADYYRLETEAERLKKIIEKVPGVKKAVSEAYPERELRISADFEKMREMNIPLNYLFNAIQAGNQNIPGGNINVGSRRLNIQTSGSYESVEDIKNIIITAFNGKPVYLKDIADVRFDFADVDYKARVKDKKAVYVNVQQKGGTNIFDITESIKSKLSEFKEKLPSDIGLETVFDQSESVDNRMTNFFGNLFGGLILVGIVVLLAVSFRSALIVMLAIPASIFIGIGFVDFSGYGIEQMTIAGLVIALGLLVDNSIVVIENITRFMKLGYNPKDAAIEATSQIAWPVVS